MLNEARKTSDQMNSTVSRRNVVKGVAWAAPAVAMAVATPLAAASAQSADNDVFMGGGIAVNGAAGTASGAFNGGMNIKHVTGTWATGQLSCSLKITGPWNKGKVTKEDGSAFVLNEVVTAADGTVWTVTSIDADADGVWGVSFTAPSKTVSADTTISLPAGKYAGTFAPGVPTSRNQIAGSVSGAAANINGGQSTANSSPYPA